MKRVAAAGAMIVVAMLGWVGHGTVQMNEKLDLIAARPPQKESSMSEPAVATWKSAYGMQSLTTVQNIGESNPAFAARHKARVLAMQVEFPIVP